MKGKQIFGRIWAGRIAALLWLALLMCGASALAEGGLTFAANEKTLTVGDQFDLEPNLTGDASGPVKYEYYSGVLSVDEEGVVTAIAPGTAGVKGTTSGGGYIAECLFIVNAAPSAEGRLVLAEASKTLEVGDTFELSPQFINGDSAAIAWDVSDSSIVTVSDSGTVRALAAGTATIVCRTATQSAQCAVTVAESGAIAFDAAEKALVVGETFDLNPQRTGSALSGDISWSYYSGVVQVSAGGVVEAVGVGEADVVGTTGSGHSARCKFIVSAAPPQPQPTIDLSHNPASLTAGQTYEYTAKDTDGNAVAVTLASSDAAIVQIVDNTHIKALAAGNATITATAGSASQSQAVTVTATPLAPAIRLNTGLRNMLVGERFQLVVTDQNGNTLPCTFTSSEPQYATVSASGEIVAIASRSSTMGGITVITARAADGRNVSTHINVFPQAISISLGFGSNPSYAQGYIVNGNVVMPVGASIALKTTVVMGGTVTTDPGVVFVSSNPSVASVDAYGVVTGRAAGTAVITARVTNSVYDTMNVTIGGSSAVLTARVNTPTGGWLNLRETTSTDARILTTIPQNAQVFVHNRGTNWSEISYGGYRGYALSSHLAFSGQPVLPPSGTGQSAQVTTPSGWLNMREIADLNARVLSQIPQYAWITVYSRGSTWSYATYNGVSGYVMTDFLTFGTKPVTPTPPTPPYTPGTTARVTTARGSLNLRLTASTYAKVLLQIPQYATVAVHSRGTTWSLVTYAGVTGYVMNEFLTFAGESAPIIPPPPSGTPTTARVTTVSGSLNLRESGSLSARRLTTIPQYAYIQVYSRGSTWSYVYYNGVTGYVMSQYLTFGATPPSGGTGVTARVTTASGSLNLREASYYGARILARIPQYAYVKVTSRGADWCAVTYDGVSGYVMTSFLTF